MGLASPGSPLEILATDWNDIQALLGEWRRGRLNFGAGPLFNQPSSLIWVKNASAVDVAAGDVLGLGAPVISPTDDIEQFKTRIAFTGAVPSTSTPHYDNYGVVQEPADKSDGYCRCVVAGLTFVKLNITHASDLYCEIANNISTYLTTGALGSSRILWKSGGTGSTDKWGLVRVGEPSGEILVKNNSGGNYAAGSNCTTLEVHTGTPGSESATGQTLSAWNKTSVAFNNGKYGSAAILQKGNAYASPLQT